MQDAKRHRVAMLQHPPHKRIRPTWHPTWTRDIEGWTANQVRKNLWRFDRAEDFDDIMQDARLLFCTLERKYPIVNEAAHFFALFKTSLLRMFIDKARVRHKSVIDQEVCTDDVALEMKVSGTPNYGFFNVMLEEMPEELKLILRALTSGRVRLKLDRPAPALRPRENHNMRLRRHLKLSSNDPVGDLKAYFVNL